jgi:acyl-CoA thioesterase-1
MGAESGDGTGYRYKEGMPPRSRASAIAAALASAALLGACGDRPPAAPLAEAEAGGPRPPAPEIPADAPVVAFLGDSIAAGLHLPKDRAFPSVLQRRLAAKGIPFRLVNAGVSGDTTSGGRARLDWLLRQSPAVVVVELGANDGFRGVPVETVEENLRDILTRVRAAGARALLLGMRLPPNYGPAYVGAFEDLYPRLAEETGALLVPHFMEGVAGRLDRNLPDGIHPTPEGHEILADNVEPSLRRLLE